LIIIITTAAADAATFLQLTCTAALAKIPLIKFLRVIVSCISAKIERFVAAKQSLGISHSSYARFSSSRAKFLKLL